MIKNNISVRAMHRLLLFISSNRLLDSSLDTSLSFLLILYNFIVTVFNKGLLFIKSIFSFLVRFE